MLAGVHRRSASHARRIFVAAAIVSACMVASSTAHAVDGGTLRVTTYNGWLAFEVITEGDDVAGDGYDYAMPETFDGAGAFLIDASTIRIQVNHEEGDASVSEVDVDLESLKTAIANMIETGDTGGVSFVRAARQAYGRWSGNGGLSFTNTTSVSNTSFARFCSSQAYAPDTFGPDRGFVDQLYITGEEVGGGDLFVLDSLSRNFYELSGVTGSASGGIGGMSADSWENNALLDTGETEHIALMLAPDGGSSRMKLYIGEKGQGTLDGDAVEPTSSPRNGLAYGSWYYLNGSLPERSATPTAARFDTTSSGALSSEQTRGYRHESRALPTRAVLVRSELDGVFDIRLRPASFDGGAFDAAASSVHA